MSDFRIQNDQQAEWAIGKIKEAEQERDKFLAHYEEQAKKVSEDANGKIIYFTGLLAEYFHTVPRRTTKTGIEKYKLPSGEMILSPAKTDYERDNAVLLPWLESHLPDAVQTKKEPAWDKVKSYISSSGEIPDGVTVVEKQPEFKLKIG